MSNFFQYQRGALRQRMKFLDLCVINSKNRILAPFNWTAALSECQSNQVGTKSCTQHINTLGEF